MNIIVSKHARERLKERLKISDKKIQQFVEKAWNSEAVDINNPRVRQSMYKNKYFHKGRNKHIREMMGYIFIFGFHDNNKLVLVTVF